MQIRTADERDLEQIKQLIDRNYDEIMSESHSPEIIKKFKEHSSISNLASQLSWKTVYVADDHGDMAGTGAFANFGTDESPKYSVSNLFVLPERHGKGVGTQIMNVLIADARKNHAAAFHVPSSRNAVSFYAKFGFTVDEVQPDAQDEITWMTMRL